MPAHCKHCPHCGVVLDEGKPRSLPQLRRYFAAIRAWYFHWPEKHLRRFTTETEFRKYLQMKAGHREPGAQIPLVGMSKERATFLAEAVIRAAGSYADVEMQGDTLIVYVPKSIAFGKLKHLAACALFDDVAAVFHAETGLDPEQVMNEHARAA